MADTEEASQEMQRRGGEDISEIHREEEMYESKSKV